MSNRKSITIGDKAYVRRLSHPVLRTDFGRNQNREPVFLCLPLQGCADKRIVPLEPEAGSQGNPNPAAEDPEGPCLIYVYRPNALECDLADRRSRGLLLRYGYTPGDTNRCIVHLIRRLQSDGEFPHEIGLFLSYPPEDVLGFILNRACNHKCIGCWKVYGDEQTAQKIFWKYKKCSKIYSLQWEQGKSIEQLTVTG